MLCIIDMFILAKTQYKLFFLKDWVFLGSRFRRSLLFSPYLQKYCELGAQILLVSISEVPESISEFFFSSFPLLFLTILVKVFLNLNNSKTVQNFALKFFTNLCSLKFSAKDLEPLLRYHVLKMKFIFFSISLHHILVIQLISKN